jgi:phosphomannomutase
MAQADIPFGAAGWRGIIGDDFTFGRVRTAAAAFARQVRARRKNAQLLVAFDTRFFSDEFARAAASTIESEGVHALLADRPTPAPAVSFEILHRKLEGGIYISAGSDPAECSGLRFFGADGAALEVERPEKESGPRETKRPDLETIDPSPAYLERLRELVRLDAIRGARIEMVYDAMHGTGARWLDRLLIDAGIQARVLNEDRDVLFDGRAPDPAPANLSRLAEIVRESGAALGLATSGDCARCGILDGNGRQVSPSRVFALVYEYLVESRGRRREQLGAATGETGAFTVRGHVPQADGILACLLVAEMVAERGPLEGQLKRMPGRAGVKP